MEVDQEIPSNHRLVNYLIEWFGSKVDTEVIESIAFETNYSMDTSVNHLLEITKDLIPIDNFDQKLEKSLATSLKQMEELKDTPTVASTHENEQPTTSYSTIAAAASSTTSTTNAANDIHTSQNKGPLFPAEENIQRIIRDAKRGTKIMILMRGLPGSGKSMLAKRIVEESVGLIYCNQYILSTDDFFIRNGVYQYDRNFLENAHNWNMSRAKSFMQQGLSPLIIDNTNSKMWEMERYSIFAVHYGYAIEILEPITPWAFNPRELSKRNVHGVPKDAIKNMLDRYDKNVTVQNLFERYNLCYKHCLPPQPRSYPPIVQDMNSNTIKSKLECAEPTSTNSLTSWNVIETEQETQLVKRKVPAQPIEVKDRQTMTDSSDIQRQSNARFIIPNDYFLPGVSSAKQWKYGHFDKGTMTSDEYVKMDEKFEHLIAMFDNIPKEYIKDVYDKCQQDMDWTVELLLEDKKEFVPNYKPPSPPVPSIPTEVATESNMDEDTVIAEDSNIVNKVESSEQCLELKQHIENNIVINPEYYSPHIRKLKGLDSKDAVPSTSQGTNNLPQKSKNLEAPSDIQRTTSNNDISDVISISSDFDDFTDYMEISDDEGEGYTEINLGDYFASQIENCFGDPSLQYPKGFLPVVEIPKTLGKQLYALYIESIFKQMAAQELVLKEMIKEDEEFAQKLQDEECAKDQHVQKQGTPDLKQIMTEQKEISRQEQINEQWKKMTPDDIAYKMTKQKLIDSFPSIGEDTLIEILAAHEYSYNDTIISLLESGLEQTESQIEKLREAPLSDEIFQEMKTAYEYTVKENEEANLSAQDLRTLAQGSQQKRLELTEKARKYFSRNMYDVATFYSDLARRQTHQWEKYNNLAVEQVLLESSKRLQDFDTIDLHHLHVPEAVNALDIFLDRNINLLQGGDAKSHNFLMIITGRGKNSPGGIARIRPIVQKRLLARGLKYEFLNPGLIRTKIMRNTPMTNNLG